MYYRGTGEFKSMESREGMVEEMKKLDEEGARILKNILEIS